MSLGGPILLTGANGQVGWELRRALLPLGPIVAPGRAQCDLSRPETLADVVRQIRPQWIINPAAYTAVDRAESEPGLCDTVNAVAPGVLAEAAREAGAGIIHFSTDYVFDGGKRTPYRETDVPAPLNYYGASKLAGEQAIAAAGAPWLVLRTGWVYGGHGVNFVRTMQRLLGERSSLSVVDDQIGAPTWARAIADAVAIIVGRYRTPERMAAASGLYHLSCGGSTTWFGFAAAIRQRMLTAQPDRPLAQLIAIPSHDYPTPAARSPYSVLDNGKLKRTFGLALPPWSECFDLAAPEFGL
ncbi:MAG TPA: dTDP-4-dehydrorhamnose reductase [Burkholderiales bacterium]